MSWIELRFVPKTVSQPGPNQVAYEITASVINANGIPAELFVFDTSTNTYSHAATVFDLLTYPPTAGEAAGLGSDFYRGAAVTQRFDRPAGVTAFIAYVKATLKQTNRAWAAAADPSVGGEEVVVYDSNSP